MYPTNQSFTELLKELRISKMQLSRDLDISRQTTDNILAGNFMPSLKIIYRILEVFPWVNVEWLITNKGDMRKPDTKGVAQTMEEKIKSLEQSNSELRKTIEAQSLTIQLLQELRNKKSE